jgi:hypothetical protein
VTPRTTREQGYDNLERLRLNGWGRATPQEIVAVVDMLLERIEELEQHVTELRRARGDQ